MLPNRNQPWLLCTYGRRLKNGSPKPAICPGVTGNWSVKLTTIAPSSVRPPSARGDRPVFGEPNLAVTLLRGVREVDFAGRIVVTVAHDDRLCTIGRERDGKAPRACGG